MNMFTGSCHCQTVKFQVDFEITELATCDCTICVKRNAVMTKVPEAALTITAGATELTLYEWNTHRAKHYFCKKCGIYVFHRKRAAPDHYGVNVFCFEDFDLSQFPVCATDGAGMSVLGASERGTSSNAS